jgi:hypothetical protein
MDDLKKSAYRYLLYHATLEIRSAKVRVQWWNPRSWVQAGRTLARVNALADVLHNLALFSCSDFEDFDEPRVWKEYEWYRSRFPEGGFPDYRETFDDKMRVRPPREPGRKC